MKSRLQSTDFVRDVFDFSEVKMKKYVIKIKNRKLKIVYTLPFSIQSKDKVLKVRRKFHRD